MVYSRVYLAHSGAWRFRTVTADIHRSADRCNAGTGGQACLPRPDALQRLRSWSARYISYFTTGGFSLRPIWQGRGTCILQVARTCNTLHPV